MIFVGQKVRFDPFESMKCSTDKIKETVVGTVAMVNGKHRWFSVLYGNNQRASFKFTEIGHNVHICK